jgi:hypothetical protein
VPAGGAGPVLAPIAGGSPEADELPDGSAALAQSRAVPFPEVTFVAVLFAAASIFFGIFPSPLFDFVAHAGRALSGLF